MPSATDKGFATSEFYMALLGIILGALVASGKITQAEANLITQQMSLVIGGIIAAVSGIAYIVSRLVLKHAAIVASVPAPVVPPAPAQGDAT